MDEPPVKKEKMESDDEYFDEIINGQEWTNLIFTLNTLLLPGHAASLHSRRQFVASLNQIEIITDKMKQVLKNSPAGYTYIKKPITWKEDEKEEKKT